MMTLKSDFHLHTSDDRCDAIRHSARALVSTAARRGFHVLAITNHDTFTFNFDLRDYAADLGILLIPGIEKTIEGKHVLILNANPQAEKIRTFGDLRRARKDGFFVVAPHPFFKKEYCLQDKLLEHWDLFDAIEFSYFYSRVVNFNREAVRLAKEKRLPVVGNSDCHILKYMGICHSLVHAESQTLDGVFDAIRNHSIRVVSRPISLPGLARIYFEIGNLGRKSLKKMVFAYEEKMSAGKDAGLPPYASCSSTSEQSCDSRSDLKTTWPNS